jgi:hypothetical protein
VDSIYYITRGTFIGEMIQLDLRDQGVLDRRRQGYLLVSLSRQAKSPKILFRGRGGGREEEGDRDGHGIWGGGTICFCLRPTNIMAAARVVGRQHVSDSRHLNLAAQTIIQGHYLSQCFSLSL